MGNWRSLPNAKSEPEPGAPPLGSTPTPVAPLSPSTQWYEAKLKEIAIAKANIDTQRVYCQTARITGLNNAHYYNEVVKFHQTTNALAEIARELAHQIAEGRGK